MRHVVRKGVAVLAAFLLVAAITVRTGLAAEYVWKLAHEEPAEGFMDLVAREFGKKLAEKSGGRIELVIYPSGTLGNVEDLVELTQNNAVQFNIASAGTLSTQIPQMQALLLQYLFPKDMDVVRRVAKEGRFRELLRPRFEERHLVPLSYVVEGWQVWTSNRPLTSPADFNNFKMRTMPSKLLVETYKAYGANPTPVEFSQVYSSLQLGMIDGQENPVYAIEDMKFYEVQDYLTFGYTSLLFLTLIANQETLAALPADLRDVVEQAAAETVDFAFACQDRLNKGTLDQMRQAKKNLHVAYLDDAAVAAFRKLARPLCGVYAKELGGEGAAPLLAALQSDIARLSGNKGNAD